MPQTAAQTQCPANPPPPQRSALRSFMSGSSNKPDGISVYKLNAPCDTPKGMCRASGPTAGQRAGGVWGGGRGRAPGAWCPAVPRASAWPGGGGVSPPPDLRVPPRVPVLPGGALAAEVAGGLWPHNNVPMVHSRRWVQPTAYWRILPPPCVGGGGLGGSMQHRLH